MRNEILVNHVLVKISKNNVQNRGSIVVVSEEPPVNYGAVVKVPQILTEDYQHYKSLLEVIKEGDKVRFLSKQRVELLSEDLDYRYVSVPIDQIFMIEKGETDA
jgi:co-chaperonin GroES (HSP10)